MGYYIETPRAKHKASWLIENEDAIAVGQAIAWPPPEGKTLICVKENGLFDAAGVMFNKREFESFADDSTNRTTHWLHMDTDRVLAHCPHVASQLNKNRV